MNSGTKDDKRRVFWLHFNRFAAAKGDPDIWTVFVKGQEQYAKKVYCKVPLETIYRGDSAPQPRAYLKGKGVVIRNDDDTITIEQ